MKSNDRRAPAAGFERGIFKGADKWRAFKNLPHGLALDPDAAAVDDPDASKSLFPSGVEVGFHGGSHVARGDCVQVENILDREFDRLVIHALSVPGIRA